MRPFHNAIKSKLDPGHNGPPPGNNVIPEPSQDRVNIGKLLISYSKKVHMFLQLFTVIEYSGLNMQWVAVTKSRLQFFHFASTAISLQLFAVHLRFTSFHEIFTKCSEY